ncbi:hypothetical protein BU25DRAFT_374116 [Macroventuria anomochaeta]|uniref:Uncharacterized protein n=1 Tax=Macroventuria anomochaeta TaxID=301207 RepID=A0ACB6RSP1_9PLEO|nr:uncharacterized protein BU25DRAFT_374116 [Macroventuria anomochaeta]KAF2624297.1 hypothetical protein BU25DRAFT_374116 [Macroventuria anomochaeta]
MAPTLEPKEIKLPGFGLPYDGWEQDSEDYAQALSTVMDWTHPVMTIRERCMLFFVDRISDKPDWTRKVHDEEIVAKWKQEAKELDWTKIIEGGDMTDKMLNYCIDELRYKADLYEKTRIIPVLDASSCVLKSDNAIPNQLKDDLRKAVALLEDVPQNQQDWHPGSDGTMLDLVHPSLFPLVYGRSRILPDSTITLDDCLNSIGKGVTVPNPLSRGTPLNQDIRSREWYGNPTDLWSHRFQWLPCNVSFPDGDNARIDSYINNLHPKDHTDLYHVIEKIITKAIPFWNVVYQSVPNHGLLETSLRISCDNVSYTLPDRVNEDMPDDFDDEEDYWEYKQRQRVYSLPEPGEPGEHSITVDDVEKKFTFLDLDDEKNEKKFQVIVKLANIHLTPEKPEYKGGSWHIEGQLNEHIVSTALYYYDNSNITESRLHFRTRVEANHFADDISYEQGDDLGFKTIWGVDNQAQNEQLLGSVLTREDRLIAFPNGFQHRVGDFRLADPTKPGHRKILALFLVAPTIPIISTANVPPQQRDWWTREVKLDESRVGQLPAELVDMIAEGVEDFPIGLEDAKAIREELMVERSQINEAVDSAMWNESFSFCEH